MLPAGAVPGVRVGLKPSEGVALPPLPPPVAGRAALVPLLPSPVAGVVGRAPAGAEPVPVLLGAVAAGLGRPVAGATGSPCPVAAPLPGRAAATGAADGVPVAGVFGRDWVAAGAAAGAEEVEEVEGRAVSGVAEGCPPDPPDTPPWGRAAAGADAAEELPVPPRGAAGTVAAPLVVGRVPACEREGTGALAAGLLAAEPPPRAATGALLASPWGKSSRRGRPVTSGRLVGKGVAGMELGRAAVSVEACGTVPAARDGASTGEALEGAGEGVTPPPLACTGWATSGWDWAGTIPPRASVGC